MHVSRWTGTAWESLDSSLSVPAAVIPAQSLALKIDPQGRAVLSFLLGTAATDVRILLRRWNGTSWDVLGEPLNGIEKDAIYSHTMSLGPDGVREIYPGFGSVYVESSGT